jgi:hypothetical protein
VGLKPRTWLPERPIEGGQRSPESRLRRLVISSPWLIGAALVGEVQVKLVQVGPAERVPVLFGPIG